MVSKYAGYCKSCRGEIKVGETINWTKGYGAVHANPATCRAFEAARKAFVPEPTGVTADGSKIVAFLTAARERGLKFPKVRFADASGREISLTLAGSTSKYPGAVQVKLAGNWIGRIESTGNVAGPLSREAALVETLRAIGADPATAAKTYGQLTGHCSFCAKELTDAGSIEVGYGPVCARKYGLPHTPKGSGKVVSLPDVALASGADVDETAYDSAPDSVDRADAYYSAIGGW